MSPALHIIIFLLLPLVLAVAVTLKRLPEPQALAQAVLRLCVGITKCVLLVIPLLETLKLVLRGGPENLGLGMAWVGFLSCMLFFAFVFSCGADIVVGMRAILKFPTVEKQPASLLSKRGIATLLILSLILILIVTGSPAHVWQIVKAMFAPPKATIASLFQTARVLSNFHVVTFVAGLAVFIGVPTTRDFLREVTPRKAVACLAGFAVALAMLWTRLPLFS